MSDQERLDALEAIGLERDYTEAELDELESLFVTMGAVPPVFGPGVHDISHPCIAFWQSLAKQPTTRANIIAMHRRIAPTLLSFFKPK